ncbi:MAG: hypothetical protein CMG55_05860 [Candidatus Marinimicrobia bacterium]|nr:hypothetical protein [Candidatus Neomarinimicrobiota bacterium]|tara:strand:- start:4941 stop:6107 length:1167 start_codon:yes stop_codon:yes gene_type:complete
MRIIRKLIGKKMVEKAKSAGHIAAELPQNEYERINDLKRLQMIEKNIEKDKRFSSFPILAATITDCEKAAINIIDNDTQYCKINYGMDITESVMMKEVPRELTVCAHVINNGSKPLVINDMTKDERTKNIFLVNKSLPKFYAGSPIITKKGFTLGSFCVFNSEPKTLDQSKINGLRMLTDQFIDLYEHTIHSQVDEIDTVALNEKISGEFYSSATVLFADFVGFTKKTEELQPGELLDILDSFFKGFDKIIERYDLKKVKTIGDAYMAVGGVPDLNSNHAERIVLAGKQMINFVSGINLQQEAVGNEPWHIRIGVHTGPIIAGTTSSQFDIWGDTVNIAARLESSSDDMKIHFSKETKDSLPQNIEVCGSQNTELKGKGSFKTFHLAG